MLARFMQSLMGADADAHQRRLRPTEDGADQLLNGYRPRHLDIRAGTIEFAVPKLRSGTYFPDWLLEPDERTASLGISGLSRSQVSVMAKDLDGQVWRSAIADWTKARTPSSPTP